MKLRRIRWKKHGACVEDMKAEYPVVIGIPEV
jgi:ribonuclease I